MTRAYEGYPPDFPKYGFHVCHGCGNLAPHHSQEDAPENGWVLPYDSFGYYGGFTDSIDGQGDNLRLCHDCVVKFLETFPLLAVLIMDGRHGMLGPTDVPCCKWAWRGTDLFGQHEDGRARPGIHVQVANDSGGWDDSEW